MQGLELAEKYYHEIVGPAFREKFPGLYDQMAFGLVGPGSECYGYDDEISRDHDWGPKVCIWIPEGLFRERGEELQSVYNSLPGECCGFKGVNRRDLALRRDGVISTKSFYENYSGMGRPPNNNLQWLHQQDDQLAQCTNGKVFLDNLGEFSAFRRALLAYYPRDVWLKKIVSRCVMISQYGQYNLRRAQRRRDAPGEHYCWAMCTAEAAALAFLLKKKYRPFYKWQFKGLEELGDLGRQLITLMRRFYGPAGSQPETETGADSGVVERIVALLSDELIRLIRSSAAEGDPSFMRKLDDLHLDALQKENYLQDIGFAIQELIEDENIRNNYGFVE